MAKQADAANVLANERRTSAESEAAEIDNNTPSRCSRVEMLAKLLSSAVADTGGKPPSLGHMAADACAGDKAQPFGCTFRESSVVRAGPLHRKQLENLRSWLARLRRAPKSSVSHMRSRRQPSLCSTINITIRTGAGTCTWTANRRRVGNCPLTSPKRRLSMHS